MMVAARRAEDVMDPNLDVKPSVRALKQILLVALRCVEPEADKRPKMTQVVQMLEADEYSYLEVRNYCLTKSYHVQVNVLFLYYL